MAGLLINSKGPLGRNGPPIVVTPGALGKNDSLDPQYEFDKNIETTKKEFILKQFEEAIQILNEAIKIAKTAVSDRFSDRKWTFFLYSLQELFKVDPEGKKTDIIKITNTIISKWVKMVQKLNEPIEIEVREPGFIYQWILFVRSQIWENMADSAEFIAKVEGSNRIILYNPGFFQDGTPYKTVIHEVAHLVGLAGDTYYMEEGWKRIKSTEQALRQADTYAYLAVRITRNTTKYRSIEK